MNYKKILCGISTLTVCFMLAGCGHKHTWTEATCTEPKTCSECGETEGEALGHTWVQATCTEPKTCSECGETEGEALGHTWVQATCTEPKTCSECGKTDGEALGHTLTEANYQQASTCEICGETVGKPLDGYYEKNGLVPNAQLNTPVDFTLPCYNNPDYKTTGQVTFSNCNTFNSDELHEELDGYEYITFTATLVFGDENALSYGWSHLEIAITDYYAAEILDESYNDGNFTVNYNGIDYTNCMLEIETIQDGWSDKGYIRESRFTYRIPVDYDGIILLLSDNSQSYEDDVSLIRDDNTIVSA